MLDIYSWLNSYIGLSIVLYLCYKGFNILHEQYLLRKLHCKKAQSVPVRWLFGILDVVKFLKLTPQQRLEEGKSRLDKSPGGTILYRLAGTTILYTKSAENIKAIYATQFNEFNIGDRIKFFGPFLGESIFTLDGEAWKKSRSILRPQFSREQIAHVQALEPHLLTLAQHIRNANGKEFDIQPLFLKYTYDTATEFLFGESLYSLRDEAVGYPPHSDAADTLAFGKAVGTASKYASLRAILKQFYWLIYPKEFKESCEYIHEFTGRQVKKALALSPEEVAKLSKDSYVILYELVKVSRNPKVIGDQLLSMFLAGRYTTASTLGFLYLELSKSPEIFAKVKEEVYSNFGEGEEANVDDISFESLKRCQYLRAVINETLRMWPVVPQNYRIASDNTTLPNGGGEDGTEPVLVTKGRTVVWLTYAIHKDKEIYGEDADEFKPERWLEPEMKKIGFAYTPFGGGPRICLGQQFALTEIAYTVVRLIQLFPNLTTFGQPYPPDVEARIGLVVKSVKLGMS